MINPRAPRLKQCLKPVRPCSRAPQARWSKTGDIAFDPDPLSAVHGEGDSAGPQQPLVAWRTGWLSVGYISEARVTILASRRSSSRLAELRRTTCMRRPVEAAHNDLSIRALRPRSSSQR